MSEPAAREPIVRQHGNAYLIFILVATLLALVIMVSRAAARRPMQRARR